MKHFAFACFLMAAAGIAHARDYRCQIFSMPGIFYRDMTWDGEAPLSYPIEYNGKKGEWKVSAIGLAGHPDYLFEIVVGGRTIMAASQLKDLTDYNLTWRSDAPNMTDAIISIGCRIAVVE